MCMLCPVGYTPERQGKKSRFLYGLKLGSCFCKLTGSEGGEDFRLQAQGLGATKTYKGLAGDGRT